MARPDAERRTRVTAGRLYTDADLLSIGKPAAVPVEAADGPGAAAPTLAAPGTPVPGTSSPGENAEAEDDPGDAGIVVEAPVERDKQRWLEIAQDLRQRLAKTAAGIAEAETRLERIDAAPRTPTTIREHEVVAETMRRLQREADILGERLTVLVEQAGVADLPETGAR